MIANPRRGPSLAVAAVLLAGVGALRAQEAGTGTEAPVAVPGAQEAATPTFPAGVEQVIVDLVVTDKKGNPVPGISAEDLVVTEDGAPQSVVSFEAVALPHDPAPEPPPPPRVSRNTVQTTTRGRAFVIVFDDVNLSPHRAQAAKGAVASFLETAVREGDYVTLVATSGSAWWTARMESGRDKLVGILEKLEGQRIPDRSPERLTDWEAMRIHVYQDPQVSRQVQRRFEKHGVRLPSRRNRFGTDVDPYVRSRATDVYFESRTRSRVALETIERALNGLASAKGRKSLILVSNGFIYDHQLDEFKRVHEASRRANTAIYFVNARGLDGMPLAVSAEFAPALDDQDVGYAFTSMSHVDDGPENLAADSGGFTVKDTNDLSKGIHRIARESQLYYLLGYASSNTARDGAFREIEVKFKEGMGKGLKIRARRGYYAPTDGEPSVPIGKEGVDPVLQAALDSPWSEDGIPLRMTHYVGPEQTLGKAGVLIVTEVDLRALEFREEEGRHVAQIQFLLVTAHRESGEFYRYDQAVNLKLRASSHERLTRLWYPIARDFELTPGDHMAKMIVWQKATGALGSVVHEFDVPSPEEFRVPTPVLSDRMTAVGEDEAPVLQPLARREFPQGGQLFCQFDVFGAEKDETGMPHVAQGYRVLASDGSVLTSRPESVIRPTPLGELSRVFGFSLETVAPGDYEIVMTVRDEIAGETLEVNEPFRVLPPVRPPPRSPPRRPRGPRPGPGSPAAESTTE